MTENLWNKYDKDHNGHLDVGEFKLFLQDLTGVFKDDQLLAQSDQIVALLDRDNNGTISNTEFFAFLDN